MAASIDLLSIDPFRHESCDAGLPFANAHMDHLLDAVLGLPVEERSDLAVALPDGFETADESTISGGWRAEVNRRRTELGAGRMQAASWTEVCQRLGFL